MSDTRNHTTRDQLAETIRHSLRDHLAMRVDESEIAADAILASGPIAAVRAAAVAETTAAIEALLQQVEDDARENQHLARLSTRQVRAALSGGRTAPDTLLTQARAEAQAWQDNYDGMFARWAECDRERLEWKQRALDAETQVRLQREELATRADTGADQ